MDKQQARELVGKRVEVNSNRVQKARGTVRSYLPKTHHLWVYLDKAIKGLSSNLKTHWHKVNAGNVKPID